MNKHKGINCKIDKSSPLIRLYDDFREELINNHMFYINQATDRLLKNFENLSADADEFEKQCIDQYSKTFNPEISDEGTLYENAFQESVCFYLDLIKLKEQTQLLIIVGMLHTWERRLRSFLTNESRYWQKIFKPEIKDYLEKKPIDVIFTFFNCMGWNIKNEPFYQNLHALILLVNAYKHGSGSSLEKLLKKYPKYIKIEYQNIQIINFPNILDDCYFELNDEVIEELSNSIIQFWEKLPKELYLTMTKPLPKDLKQLTV